MWAKGFVRIIKKTAAEWQKDNAAQAAAALAFYTIFSLAPLLIIATGVAGIIFGNEVAQGELLGQIRRVAGPQAARLGHDAVENLSSGTKDVWGTIIGAVALFVGATTVFAQLHGALNKMWGIRPKPGRNILNLVRTRLIAFVMVLVVGLLLLALLVLSAVLSAAGKYVTQYTGGLRLAMQAADVLLSLGIVTLLFAAIFRYLPDARVRWRDVWVGAVLTAFLFTLGKVLLGIYFAYTTLASVYGAAGSLVILLLWVYFSAQILFFGAEFTYVYASQRGTPVQPARYAEPSG